LIGDPASSNTGCPACVPGICVPGTFASAVDIGERAAMTASAIRDIPPGDSAGSSAGTSRAFSRRAGMAR
jgi:hypothetical protein